ncbi:MAG: AAA family ATPase [Patescibacteria group bacterium]|nr:AAA family ATPase [Patescibacteria group bacterium]
MVNKQEQQFSAVLPEKNVRDDKKKKRGRNIKQGPEEKYEPIFETEDSIFYLGVELPKASGGNFCPNKEQFIDYVNDSFSLELQKKIATAFKMNQPILIEGGTSIGKTAAIRKMCSELGWEIFYKNCNGSSDVEDFMGRYVPNPNKKLEQDPEYIWADGPVTQGLRQEDDKIKVIILDEYNSAVPSIIIRLHEVLDAAGSNGEVVLSEDASERIQVDKSKTKIIALTNPPGKGFLDRQPLDPAQLRRWIYQKEVTELSKDTFSNFVDAISHLSPNTFEIDQEKFLFSNDVVIPKEELPNIMGFKDLMEKYKEFHFAAKELLKNRQIAQDQPQAFTFDDRMEPMRLIIFIQNFYRGDINDTFKNGLTYLYVNKLEDETDRQKLLEIINQIEYIPSEKDSKREGLDLDIESNQQDLENVVDDSSKSDVEKDKVIEEIGGLTETLKESGIDIEDLLKPEKSSGKIIEQINHAKEIMGNSEVMGIEEIEKAFDIKVKQEDIPDIPFSDIELQKAKELNQFLVLRVNEIKKGVPLTMQALNKMLEDKFKKDGKGKVLYSIDKSDCWYKDEEFFKNQTPELSWSLVSSDLVPNTTSKNYEDQTKEMIEYLKNVVFKGISLPKEYQDAIKLFETGKDKEKINNLLRHNPAEFLYDILIYYQNNNKRLLESLYSWTSTVSSDGDRVLEGDFASNGLGVSGYSDGYSLSDLGALLSRKFSVVKPKR